MRLSPDGRVLRFTVSDKNDHTHTLWEVRTDGSHLRQLLAGWTYSADVCCGSWTPNGKYFVFQAARDGVASFWVIRETGDPWRKSSHEPVLLTQGEMSAEAPLPSLDGKKIFFIGALQRGELTRYDAKTHAFAPYLSGISAEGVSFSKDGQRVAYVSYPSGMVWQSRIDGSDRRQLTFSPMQAGLTQWSPDGSQIAFGAKMPGELSHIYVVPVEGGDPEQLTSGDCEEADPSWSPDGRFIAFSCGGTSLLQRANDGFLRTVEVKTRQVTDVQGGAGLFSPRWSPDGRYLLGGTVTVDKVKLYDFTTRKWQDLFSGRWDYPTWSRDGKCIYFSNHWDPKVPVNRICLADRRMEHIVDLIEGGDLVNANYGWWTGLAPDDSILDLRDTSVDEIYALDVKFP
jgi:Tol biopolymer transport system component